MLSLKYIRENTDFVQKSLSWKHSKFDISNLAGTYYLYKDNTELPQIPSNNFECDVNTDKLIIMGDFNEFY